MGKGKGAERREREEGEDLIFNLYLILHRFSKGQNQNYRIEVFRKNSRRSCT